jgi:hypothetical protein
MSAPAIPTSGERSRGARRRERALDLLAGGALAGIGLAVGPGLALVGACALAVIVLCALTAAVGRLRRARGRTGHAGATRPHP